MTGPRALAARPARRVALAAALAAAVAPVLSWATPATADPLGSARSRATALRAQVQALQTQAEVATERYDAAEAALGQAVTERLTAQQALESAQQNAAAGVDQVTARVRALYMAGGQTALLASVLGSGDLTDMVDGYKMVESIVGADTGRADQAESAAAGAAAVERRLTAIAGRVTRLQVAAAQAADTVRGLLARQQALLASADAQVRLLVAQQQAAAQSAAAQAFAAALAAAQEGGGSAVAPSPAAQAAIAAARTRLGLPYVWGATGPDSFDCSGLTQWAYAQAGVALPRVAADQWNAGPHPSLAQLAPGDLLFWATDPADPSTIHHVAIYLGAGLMLAAPHTGDVVKVQPVYLDGFVGATRPAATG